MKCRRSSRLGAILALSGLAIAAVALGPVSSAVGFFSGGLALDVQIQSPALLVARGAAIDVPLEIVCTSETAELHVQVTQRVGSGKIAQGETFQQITCEGDLQQVTVRVFATGAAFKKGTAVVQAEIFGCLDGCGSESDTAEIAIGKK
jgi:hypothetical protein